MQLMQNFLFLNIYHIYLLIEQITVDYRCPTLISLSGCYSKAHTRVRNKQYTNRNILRVRLAHLGLMLSVLAEPGGGKVRVR